jgi:Cd2+/Zn2+-exporting ATPase
VFDKTGTLTTGELSVVRILPATDVTEAMLLRVAAGLGAASSHPVSRAAVQAAPPGQRLLFTRLREEGGFGLTGYCEDVPVAFGQPALFARLGIATPPVPAHDGPIGGVSRDGVFLGWLLFADAPRAEAMTALAELRTLGLSRQVLLTGDRAAVAHRIGAELGISEVQAGMLPDEKMQRVQQETRDGFHPLVVGDGINDSLALKAGAVGIAMGAQGTDVALASADVVLISSDLRRIATAIRLSRRCRRTIHINVGIGLGWTLVLVVLAASGLLGVQGAVIAALLHNVSTFLGLANSGRLLLFDETGRAGSGEG